MNSINFNFTLILYLLCLMLNAQTLPFVGDLNQFTDLNNKGNISKIEIKDSFGSKNIYFFVNGKLTKEYSYLNLKDFRETNYIYDSIGRLKRLDRGYSNILFTYKDNQLIEAKAELNDFKLTFMDFNDLQFAETIYINDKENFYPYKIQFQYDENGNIVKMISYENDDLIFETNYAYNNRNLISSIRRLNNKNIQYPIMILGSSNKIYAEEFYKYKFDSKGNWVKKIIKTSDGIRLVESRKIDYN